MPQPASEEMKQKWKSLIHEQKNSGLSIAEWCRQNEIAVHTFYYWRDKFSSKQRLDRSAFMEITDQKPGSTGIILEYQDIRIVLDRHFDSAILKRCLKVLKEC